MGTFCKFRLCSMVKTYNLFILCVSVKKQQRTLGDFLSGHLGLAACRYDQLSCAQFTHEIVTSQLAQQWS